MKNFLYYKNETEKYEDVLETVKTMEKISASSIHSFKQDVAVLNQYSDSIEDLLAHLSLFYEKTDHPLLKKNKGNRHALIVLTGDKGLVGGLWHTIVNFVYENKEKYEDILVVGQKGKSYLEEAAIEIKQLFSQPDDITEESVNKITDYIFDNFKSGLFTTVDILYPKFVSLAEQTPQLQSFLPFDFKLDLEKKEANGIPIFDPSKKEIFDPLLQKYIKIFFYKIMMETKLSELSARTIAMEHATTKITEEIKKIKLKFLDEKRKDTTQKQLESFTAHKIL